MATRKKQTQKLDHPDQAIDTDLPTDYVNEELFAAMREVWEEENKDG